MAYTFVLSDNSINSYGTRILTEGIDLSLFKKNPIMLWMHNRVWRGDENEVLPIGKWENIRIEKNRLLADAVFDTKDEFAQKIEEKVKQGIIRMASIGVNIIATSEEKDVIVKGQTRPTIVSCLINEASLCDIGSNRNSLRMSDEFGDKLNLADGENHLLPLLTLNNKNENMNFKDVSELLQCSEESVFTRVKEINKENLELKAKVSLYEKKENEAQKANVLSLVNTAISEKKITEKEKDNYLSLASKDFSSTENILNAMSGVKEPQTAELTKKDSWAIRLAEINNNKKK